ncbi:hypothetical protein AB2N04_14650 [Nitratireductor sp. GISD-1A_MAKvit]|uniref:hypothetical protein n=1 Tax=Nitratireductor sp. GISD-1A_MAKvit TaxID=3234198 RepID=UPI003465393C
MTNSIPSTEVSNRGAFEQIDPWKLATDEDKVAALASLGSLPSREIKSAKLSRAAYLLALRGVTKYALSRAVTAILQGALGHAFFPSPPELRIQCNRMMEWHEQKEAERRRIARENADFIRQHGRPPEKTQQGRNRVRALYADFTQHWHEIKYGEDPKAAEERRKRLGMTPEVLAKIPDAPKSDNDENSFRGAA